jgi:hypothetical protein
MAPQIDRFHGSIHYIEMGKAFKPALARFGYAAPCNSNHPQWLSRFPKWSSSQTQIIKLRLAWWVASIDHIFLAKRRIVGRLAADFLSDGLDVSANTFDRVAGGNHHKPCQYSA